MMKNGKVFKRFFKYFDWFVTREIDEWTETHFINAKNKRIDLKMNHIFIEY